MEAKQRNGFINGRGRRVWRIAHRGASAYAVDNSLAAIEMAIQMGMDLVEIDVHRTLDNRLVVFHDYVLNGRAVEDYTFEELRQHRLADGSQIPTLEEIVALVRGRCGLYVEIKSPDAADLVVEMLRETGLDQADLIIGSFHHDAVRRVKQRWPEVRAAVLFRCAPVDPVQLARAAHADYVHFCWENMAPHPSRLITPELVERVRAAGLGIILWHEERPRELEHLREKDIDGICTDDPPLLYEYFPSQPEPAHVRWVRPRRRKED